MIRQAPHLRVLLLKELQHLVRPGLGKPDALGLRVNLVSAIWASIVLLEPFFDTVVTEYVLALWEAQWGLVDTLRVLDTIVIVAYDAH